MTLQEIVRVVAAHLGVKAAVDLVDAAPMVTAELGFVLADGICFFNLDQRAR